MDICIHTHTKSSLRCSVLVTSHKCRKRISRTQHTLQPFAIKIQFYLDLSKAFDAVLHDTVFPEPPVVPLLEQQQISVP